MKVQRSIEIAAHPDKIWPFMIEPQKIMEWYIPLQKFEHQGGNWPVAGSTLYFEEKIPTGVMKINCEVTECSKNEVFAFKMTSGNMMKSYEERWTVEAIPSGSRFTFTEQSEIPGFFGGLMGFVGQYTSGATINKMLSRMKTLAEE